MPTITDEEFGKITIRRSVKASQIRLRVAPDGTLRASMPLYAPIFLVKRLIKSSRTQLRDMLAKSIPDIAYHDGMQIGKSHRLVVQPAGELKVGRSGVTITVSLPADLDLQHPLVIKEIRDAVTVALRIEAKSYLPKRLKFLAEKYDLHYQNTRFSHASSRWGSCSSKGTISLNIALMKLPFEVIDYVLVHELAHTIEMNHSKKFWQIVESADPEFRQHRKVLKSHVPTI